VRDLDRARIDQVLAAAMTVVAEVQIWANRSIHDRPEAALARPSPRDPRAAERTFQLLHQVTGRAGREQGRGVGYLQTHQPEHPVMRALIKGDREAFYLNEIEQRERTGYPPFGRLASLIVSASDRHAAEAYGRTLVSLAPKDEQVRVLGPAEAPVAVMRGRHRFRLLVKSPRAYDLSGYLRDWLVAAPKTKGNLQLEIDIDPMSFF